MVTIPITLLVAHFVGDFILQSDYMALNKGKDLKALSLHVGVYCLCFIPWGFEFWFLTYLGHFLVDALTSQVTTYLWFIDLTVRPMSSQVGAPILWPMYARVTQWKRHWFFVAIGADQLLHYLFLAATYRLLYGG